MKLAKMVLAGAIAAGVVAPTVTSVIPVSPATIAFTMADQNYLNYNSKHFSDVEKAVYDAKAVYFRN